MAIIDKVLEKEAIVKRQLESLRADLNSQRLSYNQNPNDWSYLTNLAHTEQVLNKLLEFYKPV